MPGTPSCSSSGKAPFKNLGAAHFEYRNRARTIRNPTRRLQSLGLAVTLQNLDPVIGLTQPHPPNYKSRTADRRRQTQTHPAPEDPIGGNYRDYRDFVGPRPLREYEFCPRVPRLDLLGAQPWHLWMTTGADGSRLGGSLLGEPLPITEIVGITHNKALPGHQGPREGRGICDICELPFQPKIGRLSATQLSITNHSYSYVFYFHGRLPLPGRMARTHHYSIAMLAYHHPNKCLPKAACCPEGLLSPCSLR